jgi:hypothetical protein
MVEPLDVAGNAGMRQRVISADASMRAALRTAFGEASAESCLAWVSLCCWTFRPWHEFKHVPFVPWSFQVEAIRRLWRAVHEGQDLLIEKSRDMGASWLCLYVILWFWLWQDGFTAKVVSRKEELVDRSADPDCLMWKLDYALEHLPSWMVPGVVRGVHRTHLHLGHPSSGATIDGESTNTEAGRAGRRKVMLVDEAAFVDNLPTILRATADVTPCRLLISTPNGMNAFGKLRDQLASDGQVLTLHWTQHPEKALGLEWYSDIDGQRRPTSPWYRSECARRKSLRDIAQELDIDYLASGAMFFDAAPLKLLRSGGQLCEPFDRGEVEFETACTSEGVAYRVSSPMWVRRADGRLRLWSKLVDGRLNQRANYVGFADISHGAGESNSVLQVFCRETREQVGVWVCSHTAPHVFANQCVALCRWVGGQAPMQLGFESNGPGGEFRRQLHRLGWPHVLGNTDLTLRWEPDDSRIGWHSTRESKRDLLSDLRQQLATGELILHDEATVAELEQYVVYESGGVGPAGLTTTPEGGRAEHGDRVMALAGIPLTLKQVPKYREPPKRPDPYTVEGRYQLAQQAEARHRAW